jgi:hypothetical protein
MLAASQGAVDMAVRHVLAAALCASAAVPAQAQDVTAQSLLDKNLQARGGAQALGAIKAIALHGKLIFPGDFELAYGEIRARGGSDGIEARMEGNVQGLTYMQGYDGQTAWRINPFQGRKDAETMSADEARSMADSSRIDGVLQDARKDGSTIAYLGREDFDGTSAYKLKVTQKDGDEFTYLLDPDTYLEIKITEVRRVRGAPQTTETELGDYEKVDGVYFPMSLESWSQGQSNQRQRVLIESAQANPPVMPALFAQPAGPSSAMIGGAPPDASNKPPEQQPATPADQPQDSSQPPKGE